MPIKRVDLFGPLSRWDGGIKGCAKDLLLNLEVASSGAATGTHHPYKEYIIIKR